MKQSGILGIDLGTSSLKAVVYTDQMKELCCVRQPYSLSGGEHVTALHWWTAFCEAVSSLRSQLPDIHFSCISFSGYNAFTAVDDELRPTAPAILYYNTKPCAYMRELFNEADQSFVFDHSCANLFATGLMGPGIRWFKDHYPDAFSKTRVFLYSSGYLIARLTGNRIVDASRASLSALHDPRPDQLSWDRDLCRLLDIPESVLPDIYNCWETTGYVTAQAARETGLDEGIRIIAGSVDSLCASVGNGILSEEKFLDMGGSAGGLATASKKPHPSLRIYTMRYAFPDLWMVTAPLLSSARLFDWFRDKLAPGWSFDDFIRSVESAPRFCGGLIFLPYVGGSRFPYWSDETEGHFLHFSPETDITHMARAVVEGLSCAYRNIVDEFAGAGLKPSVILAAGGDTRFRTWLENRTSFTRIPYQLNNTHEVSAKGAALIGAYAIGSVPDPKAYFDSHPAGSIVYPDPDAEAYENHYRQFRADCSRIYETGLPQ